MTDLLHRLHLLALLGILAAGCATTRTGTPTPGEETTSPARLIVETRSRIAAEPDQPYWNHRLAQIHLELGARAPAIAACEAALDIDSGYAPSLSLLSRLYFEDGRHREAIDHLQVGLSSPSISDENAEVLRAGLAVHLDALGDLEGAEEAVVSLLRDGASWKRVGSALSYVRLRGETFSAARPLVKAALATDRNSAIHLNNLGIAQLQAGEPDAARASFLSALERNSDLSGPYYNLAILEKYYAMNDPAAERWFEEYWKRSREDPDGLAEVFLPGKDASPTQVAAREE